MGLVTSSRFLTSDQGRLTLSVLDIEFLDLGLAAGTVETSRDRAARGERKNAPKISYSSNFLKQPLFLAVSTIRSEGVLVDRCA